MLIHSRYWRSAEREVVVCRYTVETGDQPNGRLLYVDTQLKLEISRTGGCFMSIHSNTGDQPNGRLFYVNTQ